MAGPQSYTFPLWRGQDSSFVVKRKDPVSGAYVNYDTGTTAKVVFVSGSTELEFAAVISGHQAQFVVDDEAVKNVRNGSPWRLQFTVEHCNISSENWIQSSIVRREGNA